MKKVIYSGLAILVLGLLTVPAWAQKGGRGHAAGRSSVGASRSQASSHARSTPTPMSTQRSNKGGEVRGIERAKEVQTMNTRAATERGFTTAPGLDKAGQHAAQQAGGAGQTSSQSQQGKAPKGKGKPADKDPDESKD